MAKIIEFPTTSGRKTGHDLRSTENLARIYADCRRRNVPYPLAVFDGLDGTDDVGDRSGVDYMDRERTRDCE